MGRRSNLLTRMAAIALIIGVQAAGGCSGDGAESAGGVGGGANADASTDGSGVAAEIGPEGGTLTSADGILTLDIPPGALSSATKIQLARLGSPPAGSQGPAYDLQPEGLEFALPVRLSFAIPPNSGPLGALRVARHESGSWKAVGIAGVNPEGSRIVAETSHFSLYSWISMACSTHSDCTAPERCLAGGVCGIPCGNNPNDCPAFTNCIDGRCAIETCTLLGPGECGSPHPFCAITLFTESGTCGGQKCVQDSANAPSGECTAPGGHDLACFVPVGALMGGCHFMRCDGSKPCPSGYSCLFGDCVDENAGCACGTLGCSCSQDGDGGAGGTAGSGGGGSGASGGTGAGGAPGCGKSTCATGCCDQGTCKSGKTAAACGTDGAACASCGAGQGCQPTSQTCLPICPSDWGSGSPPLLQEGAVGAPCANCACSQGLSCLGTLPSSFPRCCTSRGTVGGGLPCASSCDCDSDLACANFGKGYLCY